MILLKNQQQLIPVGERRIKKIAEKILNYLGISSNELSILFLDNRGITEINKKYLKRNRPTNVISFALNEGECRNINPRVLGDVVISVEKAQEQAGINGTTLEEEISFLLIHGILHLIGYDHVKGQGERKRMKEKEREVYRFVMRKELLR
jgi:probable rRNA maturation factor